jgi:HEAT repeat protein
VVIAKSLHELGWKPATPLEFVRYYLAINRGDVILKVGDKALDPLIAQLSSKNKEMLILAIHTIGMLKNNKAIDSLMEGLSSDDNDVRAAIISAVGNIGDPDTVVPLIFALNDEASEVVVAACESLAKMADPSAISALVKVAENNDYVVKSAALKALGVFDDSRAISVMISGLREKRHEVRRSAIDSLIGFGPKTNVYFAECVTDPEPHVRRTGIMALRQANAASFCDVILDAVRDKEYSVRRDAIEALAALKYDKAIPEITKAIGDESPEVQVAAIEALGILSDEKSLEMLIDCSGIDLLHDEAVRAIYNILLNHISKAREEDLERIKYIKVTTVMTKKNSLAGNVSQNEVDPSKINAFAAAELAKRKQ